MSDTIWQRLREDYHCGKPKQADMDEAADLGEQQQAEIERLNTLITNYRLRFGGLREASSDE